MLLLCDLHVCVLHYIYICIDAMSVAINTIGMMTVIITHAIFQDVSMAIWKTVDRHDQCVESYAYLHI